MNIMELTIQDIKEDIKAFEERIKIAVSKLNAMPGGYLPYQEDRKRQRTCLDLEAEIQHLQRLISYANEGIEILKNERGNDGF